MLRTAHVRNFMLLTIHAQLRNLFAILRMRYQC